MDLIIGAGITDLSYALFCEHNDYMILEREDKIGGYCKTTQRGDFTWDYSGHFFHFQDKEIHKSIMSHIDPLHLVTVHKQTNIKYKEFLIEYPFQKNIHQLPKEELIDCIYDLFDVREKQYDNFKEMLYAKFGKSISEKFLIPYNTKLYACDLNLLDKDAMGRFFPYAEKEEIIRNFKNSNNTSYNASFVYPQNGAIEYVNSVASRLDPTKIKTNTHIDSINKELQYVETSQGEKIHYDRLVSTIPFPQLLQKAKVNYNPTIYTWNKVLVFNLGFKNHGNTTHQHWSYFPEKKYCFYRVGFYNNILGQEKLSLYVEIGFDKDETIHPHQWIGRVLNDLKEADIISSNHILEDYESIIMDPAYVHINSDCINDIKEKKKELEKYNIYSIGRYGSWTYCSIEDNIIEARNLFK